MSITEMGLGTAQLGDLYVPLRQADADAIVDAAWDAGIRYFDTAPHYGLGLAERRLGAALRDRPRDDYVLSTKVGRLIVGSGAAARREWDFSAAGVRESLRSSRTRLGIERIDVALVHDPEDHADEAIAHAVPELERMRDRGEISAIGVGTRDVPTLLRFVRETTVDAVMIAGRLTLLDSTALAEVVPECLDRGVAVIGAGVFNSGVLATDEPDPASRFEYEPPSAEVMGRVRALAAAAARHGFTLPEAAVAFAGRPSPPVASVVVGAESAEQVRRNVSLRGSGGDLTGLLRETGIVG